MTEKIKVVFCYEREDEIFRLKLEQQLSALKNQSMIDLWHDQNISAGADWNEEIDWHLNTAHVILLLISPDFMASDYWFSVALKRVMERYSHGEAVVIPIILRSVYWQGASFGKLQALPANALPVTTWTDPDEALFNVAEGIRSAIGKLIIRRQARGIALFRYEMQDDRASLLRVDSAGFSLDEAYKAWMGTKRDFSSNEIVGQTWVKTSNPEHTFIVHFFSDGSFSEHSLSDPGNQWQGSWELLDGKLRMRVNIYELDIFANRESLVHSGIEFAKGVEEPHSYFACFPLLNANAKHWDINIVPGLIERIFDQILDQRADTKILISYGALLCRGEMSVRCIVRILGFSRRFKERCINLKKTDEAIEILYVKFLGREVDANSKIFCTKTIQLRGSDVIIADLIDGEEYQRNFGEDTLPPRNPHFKPVHLLKHLKSS